MTVCLSVAINNPGNVRNARFVEALTINDILECSGPPIIFRRVPNQHNADSLKWGRLTIGPITRYLAYPGNWGWDAIWLSYSDAARMVEYARRRGWGCQMAMHGLWERWQAGETIRGEDLS